MTLFSIPKTRLAAGALLLPAALSILCSCKGRTAENVEPNGETIVVDIPASSAYDSSAVDSIAAPNDSVNISF